jgi:hypothetical protein
MELKLYGNDFVEETTKINFRVHFSKLFNLDPASTAHADASPHKIEMSFVA